MCSGVSLNYVPKFPSNITLVNLIHTNLSYIGEYTFYNFSISMYIGKLILRDNYITYIHPKAFYNIKALKTLEISNQYQLDIIVLKKAFVNLQKRYLKMLNLSKNKWTNLPADSFISFTTSKIQKIVIPGNYFKVVNCKMFQQLNFLTYLRLSDNSMKDVYVRGLINVKRLYLDNNSLTKVHKWCSNVDSSYVPNLKILYLGNNNIGDLGTNNFKCLPSVQIFNLDGIKTGRIQDNVFSSMPHIKTLILSRIGNPLKRLPIIGNIDRFVIIISNDFAKSEWCQWEVDVVQEKRRRLGRDVFLLVMLKNIDSKHMTSHLRSLLASGHHINYSRGVGEDLFLRAVVEEQPGIHLLRGSFACSQNSVVKENRKSLKKIGEFAFNSSSLTTLHMNSNSFHFDRTSTNVFAYCPNIENLDLSQNFMPRNLSMFKEILQPLSNLRRLVLKKCGITDIPDMLFIPFKNIWSINLGGTKFFNWKNLFFGVTSLTIQGLSVNSISVITQNSFSPEVLISLKKSNLGFNPFSCTCEQRWFLNWTKHYMKKVVNFKIYKYKHPLDMDGQLLSNYHPTVENCTPWNPFNTIIIGLAGSGAIVVLTIVFIVRCQSNIKNFVYLFRVFYNKRRGYLTLDNDEDFEYNAFVVYCEADRDWVHTKFIKRVENVEGLRLCIHHRDFEIGQPIIGNIDKFVEKSRGFVVIMSNDFDKSEWCKWKVDVVQEKRRRLGRVSSRHVEEC
ncbi:unnamed protein product [Mytilus coruscus]|uniref:TIR domain-containing protein n=1 Tax=Mytilus coruscus TaxID=42192 RepID=A0A6J8A248_MYTCO|nr:unnamed protein product [Mytilus coruscus]